MAIYVPAPCDAIHILSGPSKHLHFVLCAPRTMYARGSTLHIVLANLTTLDPNAKYDPACIVDVGDHPFVDRRSYIAYRFLRFESVPYTSDMVEQGQWTLDTPCSAALLARMTAGLCASKLVDRGVKYMFKCPGVIPPA